VAEDFLEKLDGFLEILKKNIDLALSKLYNSSDRKNFLTIKGESLLWQQLK